MLELRPMMSAQENDLITRIDPARLTRPHAALLAAGGFWWMSWKARARSSLCGCSARTSCSFATRTTATACSTATAASRRRPRFRQVGERGLALLVPRLAMFRRRANAGLPVTRVAGEMPLAQRGGTLQVPQPCRFTPRNRGERPPHHHSRGRIRAAPQDPPAMRNDMAQL